MKSNSNILKQNPRSTGIEVNFAQNIATHAKSNTAVSNEY